MLFTLTFEGQNATDLGYLLHKNPGRVQEFSLPFGTTHIFYPEAEESRCTFAMIVEVDPLELTRGGERGERKFPLEPYVNDRPYVASSYFTASLSKVLNSALNGNCKSHPELVERPLKLTAELSVVSSRGGEELIRRLWEPLGYEVEAERLPLDRQFPSWGDSRYYRLRLRHTICLKDLLSQLYVILPVMDHQKHYFVGQQEGEKLRRHGKGWLPSHPERELTVRRYLKHQRDLVKQLFKEWQEEMAVTSEQESMEERKMRLHDLRHQRVVEELKRLGIKKVIDLGCGNGKLLKVLHQEPSFTKIAGTDVSLRELEILNRRQEKWNDPRLVIFQSSLLYLDDRYRGYDAALLVEVIEHIELDRLAMVEKQLFQYIQFPYVIITTPNREYNRLFEELAEGALRHSDHRFEWTRAEFESWGNRVAKEYGYQVRFEAVGEEDSKLGAPSQMAVFEAKKKEEGR